METQTFEYLCDNCGQFFQGIYGLALHPWCPLCLEKEKQEVEDKWRNDFAAWAKEKHSIDIECLSDIAYQSYFEKWLVEE